MSELRLALALRGDDPSVAQPRLHVKTLEARLTSVEADIREEKKLRRELLSAADSAIQKLGRLLVFKNAGQVRADARVWRAVCEAKLRERVRAPD